MIENESEKRRSYGAHLTPIKVFSEFILPEISSKLYDYIWIDLFAGEGNLILPILEQIPEGDRVDFFKRHIYLFDIQQDLIERAIENAMKYGIPEEIAKNNIIQRDTIKQYPEFILRKELPVFHITNPPYLYIGYIAKHKTSNHLDYFKGDNEGYQDLYQLAMVNDLRHNIGKMIYIIPSNFLFGYSVSNKIRKEFLKYYEIKKAYVFEKRIFEYTGTNVVMCFFERKRTPKHGTVYFEGIKINNEFRKRMYILEPKNHYRAGNVFEEFVQTHISATPLRIKYYLTIDEVDKSTGHHEVVVIDANAFDGKKYTKKTIYVNKELYDKIKSNILFVRTVDTGSIDGRVGLYKIRDVFGVDGILVSRARYRTHPIQIFIEPTLTNEEQEVLMNYFNMVLEHFREKTDSEFMTTYKYSSSKYTRKYLGLSQTRKLIQTFPWLNLKDDERIEFKNLLKNKNINELMAFLKNRI